MILRKADKNDEEAVVKIYQDFYSESFPLDLSNTLNHVVADNGKIVGFGWLQVIVEANVILDQNVSDRVKFEALKQIIENGKQVAVSNNFDQLHVFTKEDKFSNILQKHLNFKESHKCLILNLDKPNGKVGQAESSEG